MKSINNENILFENTTNFSKKEVADFNNFAVKPIFIKLNILLPICFCLVGVYFLVQKSSMYLWLSMFVIAVIVAVLFIFLTKNMLNSVLRKNRLISSNTFVVYKFVDGGVYTSTLKGDHEIASFALDYKMIDKIVETKTYFYLFVFNNQAYIVDKNGMTDGTSFALAEHLKEKCSKYVVKNK